jgi:hypothetical protein
MMVRNNHTIHIANYICNIRAMSESHIVLVPSTMVDNPKRVISIEETVKGGTCRSCRRVLNVGEPRIKVMYPNVIVQYAARVGAPAFFMHPECFESNPVDYWRMGTAAYKETMPVAGFSLSPERDVLGWEKFPELHHCFIKCRELLLAQKTTSNTASPISAVEFATDTSGVSNAEDRGVDHIQILSEATITHSDGTAAATSNLEPPQHTAKPESQQPADGLPPCPRKRRAADFLDTEHVMKRPMQECTPSEHSHVGMEDCLCSCHCRFSPEELQWATPGDAAKLLGIRVAILRSLAIARAVSVFIRPSGQRVYNIPSIRKFISEHTVQPTNL